MGKPAGVYMIERTEGSIKLYWGSNIEGWTDYDDVTFLDSREVAADIKTILDSGVSDFRLIELQFPDEPTAQASPLREGWTWVPLPPVNPSTNFLTGVGIPIPNAPPKESYKGVITNTYSRGEQTDKLDMRVSFPEGSRPTFLNFNPSSMEHPLYKKNVTVTIDD